MIAHRSILKNILLNICTVLTLIDATIGGCDLMNHRKIESGLRNEDLGRILLDTCCHTLKFESNDTNFCYWQVYSMVFTGILRTSPLKGLNNHLCKTLLNLHNDFLVTFFRFIKGISFDRLIMPNKGHFFLREV